MIFGLDKEANQVSMTQLSIAGSQDPIQTLESDAVLAKKLTKTKKSDKITDKGADQSPDKSPDKVPPKTPKKLPEKRQSQPNVVSPERNVTFANFV